MENLKRALRIALCMVALASSSAAVLAQDRAVPRLAILPFEVNDTSGEAGASQHAQMLARLTAFVGARMARSGLYAVLPQERVAEAIAAVDPGTYLRACNGCEIDIGRRAGAEQVMIGWFWKVSTLIGSLHVEIKDVATGRTVYAKVFDFRGDNDKSWQRAADYMVKTLDHQSPQDFGQ